MDGWTQFLIGITAAAVTAYVALIYGSCALDAHCHLRSCGGRYSCGVTYDSNGAREVR